MSFRDKVALLLPWEDIESSAQQQIETVASYPFVKKMAIMPDCHAGYDMPIGGVALLDNVISPAFVGYDIGCGVTMGETDMQAHRLTEEMKEKLYADILATIPMGVGIAHPPSARHYMDYIRRDYRTASSDDDLHERVSRVRTTQFGTLGSGNHFIEIGVNNRGLICITVHSGSRKPGYVVASHYMRKARETTVNGIPGFFSFESTLGRNYHTDMVDMVYYAKYSREWMLYNVLNLFPDSIPGAGRMVRVIDECHNIATQKPDGILHRKGATPADRNALGLIPTNMRDGVYVTEGLGNDEFLSSASHGAGRAMSRTAARKNLDVQAFRDTMLDSNVICDVSQEMLEESPDAYKPAHEAIRSQDGVVVNVTNHILPIINCKG